MLSILFYIIFIAIAIVLYFMSWVALIVCYPFDKGRRVVHELSRWLCFSWWYAPFTWRRNISGLEYVDKKKPYVIVINHNSMVDIICLYKLPLVFKWVSKKEVYRIPIVGPLLYAHGDIVIDRASTREAMQMVHNQGKEWLKRGASVSIFPEGTRSRDNKMKTFKETFAILSKELNVPVVPVAITGSESACYGGSIIPKFRKKINVEVMEPMLPAKDQTAESFRDKIAALIEKHLVDNVQLTINN